VYPAVYMDFFILLYIRVQMSHYQKCPLETFTGKLRNIPNTKKYSSVKCPCSKQDQIRTGQEPRSKTLEHLFFRTKLQQLQ